MPGEFGAILRRRKYSFALPAVLILLLSIVLAFTLPPVYRSSATILIEQKEIPDDMVSSTITGYAAEQIERVRSRVMSKAILLTVVKEFYLYPELMKAEGEDEVVRQMIEDIGLEMVVAEAQDAKHRTIYPTIAFTLFYEHQLPETAQWVTAKLSELFLSEYHQTRIRKAQTTSVFLADEVQRLWEEISGMEARLAGFKEEHSDRLPETIERNQELRHSSMLERSRLSATVGSLEEQRGLLNNQLAQFGSTGKLDRAREELSLAREKYQDIHPDVIALADEVKRLESSNGGGRVATSDNPEYFRIRSQLQGVLGELRSSRIQLKNLDKDIATYEARLARSPEVERQYLELTRNLDNATEQYGEISAKLMEARLAEELEKERKADRIILLDAANLPKTPIRPNRIGFALLGIMLALCGGVGIAAFAEYNDRRIYGSADLVAIFGAPPLGTIPEIPASGSSRN